MNRDNLRQPATVETVRLSPPPLSYYSMHPTSLEWVHGVANAVYGDEPGRRRRFFNRLSAFPAGCMILLAGSGVPKGYLFGHPWDERTPPADTEDMTLPPFSACDTFVIHDLVVVPDDRRHGYGRATVNWIKAYCDGVFTEITVMASEDSEPFWLAQGFEPSAHERIVRLNDPDRRGGLLIYSLL